MVESSRKTRKQKEKKGHSRKRATSAKHYRGGSRKVSRPKKDLAKIVRTFLEMLNTVKLYHWKTRSYAQHRATDKLYESLNENIDKFVEVLLGKEGGRIRMMEKKMDLIDNSNANELKECIYRYREFFIKMNDIFHEKRDSDIFSIRDDLLVDLDQFLYLMTFNK